MHIEQSLYDQILRMMPIPCVDVMVFDEADKVLLLKRKNEPALGQWWFPGGRVLFGETREEAARRKLLEECGLVATRLLELSTFELFFNIAPGALVHSITTLFKVQVGCESTVRVDCQSDEACWRTAREWLQGDLHQFISKNIRGDNL